MSEQQTHLNLASYSLRQVGPDDVDFLQEVYASSRLGELTQLPWNEEQRSAFIRMQFTAQRQHYLKHFPNARQDIILQGENPIGRLYVDRREQDIHILDITLLPDHRGKGIGTSLLTTLIDEAKDAHNTVTIYVESFNPSRRLFERLGFHELEAEGINLLLEHPAGQAG